MVVLFETPLGLYLSKAYLERNPGAMDKIADTVRRLGTAQ